MNITPGLIYWITRVNFLHVTFFITTFILCIFLIFIAISIAIAKDENNKNNEKEFIVLFKKILNIFVISLLGTILIPTSKELAAAIIIPKIANSEEIKNIGDGIYTLALDWMKELSPKNKNGENK